MVMPSARRSLGQVTLEWLMLGLVALSLLLIASAAIARAQNAQTNLAEKRILQLQIEELGYYADQICVLGEGNAHVVALSPLVFELRYADGALNMSKGRLSAMRATACPVMADRTDYKGRAYLRFERDALSGQAAVRIANQP